MSHVSVPQLPRRCPRLFVHSLPDVYRISEEDDASAGGGEGRGIGRPTTVRGKLTVYNGQMYQLGEIFYERALGYHCRTHDPAAADLFLIPAYKAMAPDWSNEQKRDVAEPSVSSATRTDALLARLRRVRLEGSNTSVLEARGGADHILLVPREGHFHDTYPWWELDVMDGRLGATTRLALHEFQSAWSQAWSSIPDVLRSQSDLFHSVPHPSVIHMDPTATLVPWHREQRRHRFPLVGFAAMPRPGDSTAAKLREALARNCASHGSPWCHMFAPEALDARAGEQRLGVIAELYYNATFCLQPIGASPALQPSLCEC